MWATTCPLLGFACHLVSPEPALWVSRARGGLVALAVVLTLDLQPEQQASGRHAEFPRTCPDHFTSRGQKGLISPSPCPKRRKCSWKARWKCTLLPS